MWRAEIFERDNYTCQICGKRDGKICADHIISFLEVILKNNINSYEEAVNCSELWELKNGRTLCYPCHYKTDNYGSKNLKKITWPEQIFMR